MRSHLIRNYRIISVMFWSFPYLLWQTSGHWSGFLVGVIIAVILSTLLSRLWRTLQVAEPRQRPQAMEAYWRPHQVESEEYRARPEPYLEGERQQYEEMQVSYPEMPPMEQQYGYWRSKENQELKRI